MEIRQKILELFKHNDGTKYYIFVDMDGVLVDFDSQFSKYIKSEKDIEIDTANEYDKMVGKDQFQADLSAWGEEFWTQMDWIKGGKELWEFVSPYDPIILSAPSKSPETSIPGKRNWLYANITNIKNYKVQTNPKKGWDGVSHIILNHLKWKFVINDGNIKSILIDDRPSNISNWEKAGGIGILHDHNNLQKTIDALRNLGIGTHNE